MPKEIVRDVASMYDVIVGWERDKYLQVGIATADGLPIVEHLTAGADTDPQAPSPEPAEFRSLWGTLDRHGVNQLIRQLRRARDQAFGRDE